MCTKSDILTPKTTGLTHGAYIYLETQTVEECIRHADAALHLWLGVDCLNMSDNGMIYFDIQQVDE